MSRMNTLSDTEMDRINGGEVDAITVTCIAAGSAAGFFGTPFLGVLTALTCNELLRPAELA